MLNTGNLEGANQPWGKKRNTMSMSDSEKAGKPTDEASSKVTMRMEKQLCQKQDRESAPTLMPVCHTATLSSYVSLG